MSGNACCQSVLNILSSSLLNIKMHPSIIGCCFVWVRRMVTDMGETHGNWYGWDLVTDVGETHGHWYVWDTWSLIWVRHMVTDMGETLGHWYGWDTWSLTVGEECRLRVFESIVLRRIFGTKWDDITREWRKLHSEELNDLYSSPSIVRLAKSKEWDGQVMWH